METKSANEELHIGRYANVLMDRWFKRSFGTEENKRLLELLLHELIPERTISELELSPQEYVNPDEDSKDIRVDIAARDASGQRFLVEFQLARQEAFYERAIFNSSFIVQQQIERGESEYDFPPVYFIGIMDFSIHKDSDEVLFRYALRRKEDGELMSDRLQFLFLELPNCKSALTPKATLLDNFCYALKNLPHLDEQPAEFSQEIFTLLFNSAEIATFSADERNKYKHDMTTQRDIRNQIAYARKEGVAEGIAQGIAKGEARGRAEGKAEGKIEVAKNLIKLGMSSEQVCQATGMTPEQVRAL